MFKYTINLCIESISIFLYYIVQGFGLLTLNLLGFLGSWCPYIRKKCHLLSNKINMWFNDRIGY